MSTTQTSCPECGEPVSTGEPCPHCGADVEGANEFAVERGGEYHFDVEGEEFGIDGEELELKVRVESQWADLLSRTVFTAEVVGCESPDGETSEIDVEELASEWFLVEEAKERHVETNEGDGTISEQRVRRPIAVERNEGRSLYLYRNDVGVSLAELVALADRRLAVRQVADVFSALLSGLRRLHENGHLHLALSPELIRIKPAGTDEGVPLGADRPSEIEASSAGESGREGDVGDDDEAGQSDEWGSQRYDETQPQAPLGIRLSDLDSEEIAGLTSDAPALGDETSEVDESGMPSSEHWIRELGIEPDASRGGGIEREDGEGMYSDSRRDAEQLPEAGVGMELEAVFESTGGLYDGEQTPDELATIPGFSPPEAYSEGGSELGEVSDVFSAGMVLYYLVAGRRPPASVYTRHGPALPARNFRPEFPPGLGPVIKRATRPDPEMRYPDISSMQSAFENALEAIEDRTAEQREQIPSVEQAVDRHAGIAKRERNPVNQDNVFEGSSDDGEFALIVVADGVSTASFGSGDIASEMLVEAGEEIWQEVLPNYLMGEEIDEVRAVEEILENANERIVDYVNERHTPFTGSAHEVMGTTGLVALYHEGTITLGAVGDSRAYLQRGPGLEQLTVDHNLWSLSILEGLPADDALSMPRGDALARCLGTFLVEDGELEPVPPGYDVFQFPVVSGDTLLLTTDGLVDFAGGNAISAEENILATLLAEPEPALACLELILLANRGGGGDNIGLGVIRFQE